MNIILVSNNMAKAKALSLWQVALLLSSLVVATAMITAALILPQSAGVNQGDHRPFSLKLINALRDNSQAHLNALARQLGEVQAKMMRLDALSARLAQLAGVKDREFGQRLDGLVRELDARSERLDGLEAILLQQNLKKNTIPSERPVQTGYKSSGFGWRTDPMTGKMALHEGLDFAAEVGSPIYAAADGVVAQAGKTPDYGNIVKIDHGSGLETRYAHASRLLVKAGERVVKGQLIAEVGNTGRSTGAHLHFEVRLNGVALDPRKYLQSPRS